LGGPAPAPAGRAYSAPQEPLADREEAGCPLPKNPIPAFGFLGLTCPHPQMFNPP